MCASLGNHEQLFFKLLVTRHTLGIILIVFFTLFPMMHLKTLTDQSFGSYNPLKVVEGAEKSMGILSPEGILSTLLNSQKLTT